MLDIHTVGAGGGSLARFDAAGVLRVGPESAGADSRSYFVTDEAHSPPSPTQNLLLGRLPAHTLSRGDFTLDLERTRRLTQEWLHKQPAKLTLNQFCRWSRPRRQRHHGKSNPRGLDRARPRIPATSRLVAFGGAGGLHACALAEALSIPQVIVPALPGALSALGILASDVVKEYSRTVLWRISGELAHAEIESRIRGTQTKRSERFSPGGMAGKATFHRQRRRALHGQGYELNIPLTKNLLRDFEQEHRRRYGYTHPNREIELVTLRLRATLRTTTAHVGTAAPESLSRAKPRDPGRARLGRLSPPKVPVQFDGKKLATKIYQRDQLEPGQQYSDRPSLPNYSATHCDPAWQTFQSRQS